MFEREVNGVYLHQAFQRVISQIPKPFLEVLAILAVLVVTVTFILLGRSLTEMLPVLALLAVAVVRMVPAFNSITSSLTAIRYQRSSLELVCDELLQFEQTPRSSRSTAQRDSSVIHPLREAVRLEEVEYVYPNSSQKALDKISLTIRAGEVVALIGSSGAGKSTVVDVILGLLTPVSGRVMIDNWDLQDNPPAWQRQIGYIPQDIYLLDDTIRRNIAFGLVDEAIDEQAVAAALVAAQLDEFIATLPDGLDTVIGNRGIRLSGGQRQRVGIARALYHNPRVLVMDEATSALDNETEREVIAAINRLRGDRTIIMIAHRLTTVRSCDRLYLLDGGRIVDSGDYDELSNRHHELRLSAPVVSLPNEY
jgi:ATP-binding cassette subfamily C protein